MNASVSVRISGKAAEMLSKLSTTTGYAKNVIIDAAIEMYKQHIEAGHPPIGVSTPTPTADDGVITGDQVVISVNGEEQTLSTAFKDLAKQVDWVSALVSSNAIMSIGDRLRKLEERLDAIEEENREVNQVIDDTMQRANKVADKLNIKPSVIGGGVLEADKLPNPKGMDRSYPSTVKTIKWLIKRGVDEDVIQEYLVIHSFKDRKGENITPDSVVKVYWEALL